MTLSHTPTKPNHSSAIMIQACTSDAGKSTLAAGLCRLLADAGIKVAPFKPQNMALNSAVTADGGEIGRAQAVQARACGIEPLIDMNPILLKPNSDTGSQVIVHGKALTSMDASAYHDYKSQAMSFVMESYQRLNQQFDCIVVEGAGSPAEINLRDRDVANMGFAEQADVPVIIVADIERGGVFAHLVGTLDLLSDTEKARVKGLVINCFRGDVNLLTSGVDWLEEHTGKPVLGVLPYLHNLQLEAEDSVGAFEQQKTQDAKIKVIAPILPRISNHTDFDALRAHPQIDFEFVPVASSITIPSADLIILPGSKSVRSDLQSLKAAGWHAALQKHLRYGGKVIGICGGYQMLGLNVKDPLGIEGDAGESLGFGLLKVETELAQEKQLILAEGTLVTEFLRTEPLAAEPLAPELLTTDAPEIIVKGYEIHVGVSQGEDCKRPLVKIDERNDGAISTDGQVCGTYLHGIFDESEVLNTLLSWAGLQQTETFDYRALQEQEIQRVATMMAQHMDLDTLADILNTPELTNQKQSAAE